MHYLSASWSHEVLWSLLSTSLSEAKGSVSVWISASLVVDLYLFFLRLPLVLDFVGTEELEVGSEACACGTGVTVLSCWMLGDWSVTCACCTIAEFSSPSNVPSGSEVSVMVLRTIMSLSQLLMCLYIDASFIGHISV